jgi:Transposase DDE domain
VDWFFSFKLHIILNELGQLLNVTLIPGNIDDRKPVPRLNILGTEVTLIFALIFCAD